MENNRANGNHRNNRTKKIEVFKTYIAHPSKPWITNLLGKENRVDQLKGVERRLNTELDSMQKTPRKPKTKQSGRSLF